MAIDKIMVDSHLIAWVTARINREFSNFEDFFDDLGLDSLHFSEMISDLEMILSIEIDFSTLIDWTEVRNINGLTNFIMQNLNE